MATVSLSEDGKLEIQVGEPDDITTQLGKRSDGKYEPYIASTRYKGLNIYYSYVIKNEYIPSNFDSTDDFVETLRLQSSTNEFIESYCELAGEFMNSYLKKIGLIDENTYFVQVPSSMNDLTDLFFSSFIGMSNKFVDDGIILYDEFNSDMFTISDEAPKEAVEYFERLFSELNKVDSYFDFEDMKIDTKHFKYLNGFVKILWGKFEAIPDNAEIILVRDKIKNGHIIYDVIDQLSSKFNIVGSVHLFRQL